MTMATMLPVSVPGRRHRLSRLAARVPGLVAAGLLVVMAACGPQGTPDETGVGGPLPDTFPMTGVESDLPEGMPLPPETEPTPPQADTTRTQPY
jgi:hypothetical protein